jgi:hypothetical protein
MRRLELRTEVRRGSDRFPAELASARALFLHVENADDLLIERLESRFLPSARAHGVLPVLICPLAEVDKVRSAIATIPHWRRPNVYTAHSLHTILDQILDHDCGPPCGTQTRFAGDQARSDEDKVLLQRAFHDCADVKLSRLPGGASADVFQAFATLKESRVGPHPLPFFVKLDRRPKIEREIANYRDCTASFVPFYARPNIDDDRCFLGDDRGIIVGNFADQSSPLADLINQGSASTAITSLFDDALNGWRRQGILRYSDLKTATVADSLGGAILGGFSEDHRKRAEDVFKRAKRFGATLDPQALADKMHALPPHAHRCVLMHGDLHGDNVRVRNGQAILIDFAQVQPGPIVGDPAALDAALALSTPLASDAIWKVAIDELYTREALVQLPHASDPGSPSSCFWDAIRQIRRFGLAEESVTGEYAAAVAVFLFRHSFRKPRQGESPDRRPYLYAACNKLMLQLP